MSALIERIAELLDGDDADRERRAWSIVALMVGGILISRTIPEESDFRLEPVEGAQATVRDLLATSVATPRMTQHRFFLGWNRLPCRGKVQPASGCDVTA
ncbi:hypothetical protein [Mycobacterium paraintracellulare]|uniref:hypothetical protein n=1 Tax=Mycobacterium paraintracellulare TaxID=1138383 RepID=UPI00191682DC|nr:hypothetical protein [Mycobacterium paraintracellulare]